MPNADTFEVAPIHEFVTRWLAQGLTSVDPFARNSTLCTWSNDMNPETIADYHMDARAFLRMIAGSDTKADIIILDPPYSPRQVSDCYAMAGKVATQGDTQNSALYKEVRDLVATIINPDGIVLSFGWNTVGMGKLRGYEIEEILLVCHGGAHNDTICMAERNMPRLFT